MKAILISDWHLIDRPIFSRKDDPYITQFNKLHFIFSYAVENDIGHIFQAGDMFDKPRSYKLLEAFIEFYEPYSDDIFINCVVGQHDMIFRRIQETNMSILNKSGYIKILNEQPFLIYGVYIYGQSWNQKDIPKIKDKTQKNLLVTHSPIALNSEYPGHNFIQTKEFNDFGFVLCGDTHREFFQDNVLNTGPLLRLNTTLKNHNPCFYILDWDKKDLVIKRVEIPHESDIFQEKMESQSLDRQGFEEFVEEIKEQEGKKTNFYDILEIRKRDEIPAVQKIIDGLKEK